MPLYPQELLQTILSRVDLVQLIGEQVVLRRSGRSYLGLCPFHEEKTPSFTVDGDKQLFYCFGCQTGGTAFSFLQKRDNLSFPEAVELLAERGGVALPSREENSEADEAQQRLRRRLYDAMESALHYYQEQLVSHPAAAKARRYLTLRQLDPETIKHFQLGYAPASWRSLAEHLQVNGFGLDILEAASLIGRTQDGNYYDRFRDRVIFPIFDQRGRPVAFGGRIIDADSDQPKYINSSQSRIFDKGSLLYGLHLLRNTKPTELVIYEGYMDMISAWQGGATNGLASLGTALTQEHSRLLKRLVNKVILCYDADRAGQAGAERGIFMLHQQGVQVWVARVPEAKDPDAFIRLYGGEAFRQEVLQKALPVLRYCKESLSKSFNMNTIEGKSNYVREFCIILSRIASPIEEDEYLRELARELDLTYEAIRRERQRVHAGSVGQTSLTQGTTGGGDSVVVGELGGTTARVVTHGTSPREERGKGQGLVAAQETLLAIALADIRKAQILSQELPLSTFSQAPFNTLAEAVWSHFTSLTPVPEGYLYETELTPVITRLSFVFQHLLDGADKAFNECLEYLKMHRFEQELAELSAACTRQLADGDHELFANSMQRMQELQQAIANLKGRKL
ncbi:MAG: DNA primase [Symbiobacteriaceae bacterium]|nr:DNA primase [Symbiobacteriaceae bacterium]